MQSQNHRLFDDKDMQVVPLPRDGPLYKTTAYWRKSIPLHLMTQVKPFSGSDVPKTDQFKQCLSPGIPVDVKPPLLSYLISLNHQNPPLLSSLISLNHRPQIIHIWLRFRGHNTDKGKSICLQRLVKNDDIKNKIWP